MAVNPLEPVVAPVTPAPVVPAAASPAAEVALEKKYGGDWSKANEGYFSLVKMTQEVQAREQAVAKRAEQLEGALSQLLGGGHPNAMSSDPLSPLQTELGLPVEPFRAGIKAEVESVLKAIFDPIMQQTQAEETLSTEIPDFSQQKAAARQFMAGNQEVADMFNALKTQDPVKAWKYAIRETILAKGGTAPQPPRSAGLPGSGTPQGRGPAQPVGTTPVEAEKAAWEYYNQFGDNRPALAERFKGTSVERHVQDALKQMGYLPPDGGETKGW